MRTLSAIAVAGLVYLAAQVAAQQTPVFRAGTDLVQLDVSVLDKNHQPVKGLTAADFTVLEDRQPQAIAAFSAIDLPDLPPPTTPWMRDIGPDVASNELDNHRLFILVLDDASAAFDPAATKTVLESAKSIIRRLGRNDLATIVFTRDNRHAQELTSDRAKLLAAVDTFTRLGHAEMDCLYHEYSVAILKRLAEYLAAVPERKKTLVYLSPGQHAWFTPSDTVCMQRVVGLVKDAFVVAQRANVNFYTIDPCGLRAAKVGDCQPGPEVSFLQTLAENTGGRAIVNTNDFEPGIAQIFRENGSYYLLGYRPTNSRQDGTIRLLDVKVKRPDVEVWTRKSYVAPKPAPPPGANPPERPSPAVEALASILPKIDVPLRVAVAPFAVPGKNTATVAIALGVRQPAQTERVVDDVTLLVKAFTREGVERGSATQTIALNIPPPRRGSPFTRYDLLTQMELKPGEYELRFSAHSEVLDKFGSVYVHVDVPDFAKAPLSLSGVVIDVAPGVPAAPIEALKDILAVVPTSEREFARVERVSAFARVYQGGKAALARVAVAIRILDDQGKTAFEQKDTMAADAFTATRAADEKFAMPLARLLPGEYLLQLEASLGTATARRDVQLSGQVTVPTARAITATLRAIGRSIRSMEEPAVEKIAEDTREDAFQVLIATLLSAQTRDAVTHAASTRLFKAARTPATMARLRTDRIERLIYPVSFYRTKAPHVKAACRLILSKFGGQVPHTMEELLELPGVGRKTANLVLILSHASKDNICVDTHVHRIANRLGWVQTKTPEQTEHALYRVVPRRWWPDVNLYLVTWGQNVCRPVYPRCRACVVSATCPRIGVKQESRT